MATLVKIKFYIHQSPLDFFRLFFLQSLDLIHSIMDKCFPYNPQVFQTSPSIMTYVPGGRLGNKIQGIIPLSLFILDSF